MVKIKICGITNLEDALASLFSVADAIGFVFYKQSPRFIEPIKARNISRILPKKILRVGVFVDEQEAKVKKIAKLAHLDMLQLHGNETTEYCKKFKGYKIIKAFRVDSSRHSERSPKGSAKNLNTNEILRRPATNRGRAPQNDEEGVSLQAQILKYKTFAYLFDTFSKNKAGGTGRKFNWNLLKNTDKIRGQLFLSGGLTSSNVKSAIKKLHPDWVDVSSSVESKPGKKDHKKIKKFIEVVK